MKASKNKIPVVTIFLAGLVVLLANCCYAQVDEVAAVSAELQHKELKPGITSAVVIKFKLEKDWHFYASGNNTPEDTVLKVGAVSDDKIRFSEVIYPESEMYFDELLQIKLNVFSRDFKAYIPFQVESMPPDGDIEIKINISGVLCSGTQCRSQTNTIDITIPVNEKASMEKPAFVLPQIDKNPNPADSGERQKGDYSIWTALSLAFAAGLILNIMPCIWPILPIIVMRIVEQAQKNRARSTSLGLSFCAGILLFFAALAVLNIILRVAYGSSLQWGDHLRNPDVLTAIVVMLVGLALFMFGLFTITIPSAVAAKSSAGNGFTGAAVTGFFAAVLSTPCSFGILAAAFAWAQTQGLVLATVAIMTIGVGMALPYAVLTSVPALLKKLPKPGQWMELAKQAIGFVLLAVAVKFLSALPLERRMNVLYFAVCLSVCVWVWGGWINFKTSKLKKHIIRFILAAVLVASGSFLLGSSKPALIEWQEYDPEVIKEKIKDDSPVLIKFTADWCFSCKVADKLVFKQKDIAELISQKGVYAVKADTTIEDFQASIDLKNIYNEPGVPVCILFLPGGDEFRWRGINFAKDLEAKLQALPDK